MRLELIWAVESNSEQFAVKPFKDYLRDFYETWMVENVVGKPSRLDVAKWVDAAWKKISEETIKNGWRKVGL